MNCDFIAPWYRWLEYLAFGPALQRRRMEYLDAIADARRVLILGDGDGRFAAELLTRNRSGSVDLIDVSAKMMQLAERRLRDHRNRVRMYTADATTAELDGEYDAVVTHFFLDCFADEQLKELLARVAEAAGPEAKWLVSEFRVPPSGIRRLAGLSLVQILYLAFGILTGLKTSRLPDYAQRLRDSRFRRVRQRVAAGGLLVSELWQRV